MVRTVYVFGNEDVVDDSAPLLLMDRLSHDFPMLRFVRVLPNADLPFANERDVIIFDTVQGIDGLRVLHADDLTRVVLSPRTSVHDFDLGFQLKYLLKLGKLTHITLIGLPIDREVGYDSIHDIFKKLVAQDMQGS